MPHPKPTTPWSLAALVLLAVAARPPTARAAPHRPNVLLILADDMGFSDVGCYGSEIRTPNIDALAADGLRYTQMYNGARCCPSRAALLTGLYAQQTGVGLMDGNGHQPGYTGSLNDSCITLAQALRPAGYQTFMSGKWHVGAVLPTSRGFDRFYGFYTGYTVNSYNPNQMGLWPPGQPVHRYAPGQFYATDAITDYALDFIGQGRRDPARPWFLYLAYQAAHFPLMAPEAEVQKYVPTYLKGWDAVRDARLARLKSLGVLPESAQLSPRSLIPNLAVARRDGLAGDTNPAWDTLPHDRQVDLAYRMAIYAAMVEHMDRDIGRVIADLKAHHDLDDTVVFFLSDNGACAEWAPYGFDARLAMPAGDGTAGDGHGFNGDSFVKPVLHTGPALATMGQRVAGMTGIGFGSGWANACNTPFRMYKHYDHEGGIATPLVVRWPAGFPDKGAFRQQVGHVIDFMPTLLDLAAAPYPKESDGHPVLPMEGRSLVPTFTDHPIDRGPLFWEHEDNRAVRVGDLKLVSLAGRPWELYDMSKDREELHDLTSAQPAQAKSLAALWDAWAQRCHVYPKPGGAKERRPGKGEVQLKD